MAGGGKRGLINIGGQHNLKIVKRDWLYNFGCASVGRSAFVQMMGIFQILIVFCFGLKSFADEPLTNYVVQMQTARSNIVAVLPKGWSVFPPDSGTQAYTDAYFKNIHSETFALVGPNPWYLKWKDQQGIVHHDTFSQEAICFWIAPASYEPPFPSRWLDHPPFPDRIYSSKEIKIYVMTLNYVTDTNKLAAILKKATETIGGEVNLSWKKWKKDIMTSLKK